MKEFIALMAFLMALIALSIDAVLPAMGIMTYDLGITRANDIQHIITAVFLGMAVSTLIYGPLSDSIGRKPTLFIGLFLFLSGSIMAVFAENITYMLIARFIQGLGVGAPRTMTMSIVRDKFEGRQMASVMSLIMGFFIIFPAIAPAAGQAVLKVTEWQGIFILYILCTAIAALWAYYRLDETLTERHRRPFNLKVIANGFKETITTRVTMGYTICSGIVFGALLSYINSSQQIFTEIFDAGERFPLYFGILALGSCAAFFCNSRLVTQYGMRKITVTALISVIISSSFMLLYTLIAGASLPIFMICAFIIFFCLALTFGNMGAMALEPMGHIAGLASAFMGAASTIISLLLGGLFGQLYNGTILPLASSFLILSAAGFITMLWTEQGFPREHHPQTA